MTALWFAFMTQVARNGRAETAHSPEDEVMVQRSLNRRSRTAAFSAACIGLLLGSVWAITPALGQDLTGRSGRRRQNPGQRRAGEIHPGIEAGRQPVDWEIDDAWLFNRREGNGNWKPLRDFWAVEREAAVPHRGFGRRRVACRPRPSEMGGETGNRGRPIANDKLHRASAFA